MLPVVRNNPSARPTHRLASLFGDDLFNRLTPQGRTVLPMGLWQDEDSLYIEVDVPGLTEKDIDLSLEQDTLTIRGERKCERQGGFYDARRYGSFEQQVILPTEVNPDGVTAKLTNGVLSITLPKSPASKPQKIAVRAE